MLLAQEGVSEEWRAEAERRRALLLELEDDPEGQERERRRCADDPIYFINSYGWTFDPRDEVKFRPFLLWPVQVYFIKWIDQLLKDGRNGLCEKSRDTGATWCAGCYACHGFLFKRGFKATFGSRKQEYVDSSDNPDSIFEKIRMFLRMLPSWMMPKGWDWNKHSRMLRLVNRRMRSTITGEGGKNMGRGGRATLYVLDEAAFVEQPEIVENALSAVARTRLDISTPNGMGNPFQVKRDSGKIPVFRLFWKDDPRKNAWVIYDRMGEVWSYGLGQCTEPVPAGGRLSYPWWDKEEEEKGPIVMAQEYGIDYAASLEGLLVPALWVQAAVDLAKRYPEVMAAAMRHQPVAGQDVADEGGAENVFIARRGPLVFAPKTWKSGGPTDTANTAETHARNFGVLAVLVDAIGVGAGVISHWVARSRSLKLPYEFFAVKWGGRPTEAVWPDKLTSQDKFEDLKAELHWIVRRRFERTFEFVEQGIEHNPADLISIPNDPELIRQCSLVRWFTTEKSKIVIESKKELVKRGVKSPDLWDALVLTFAPRRKKRSGASVGGKRKTSSRL